MPGLQNFSVFEAIATITLLGTGFGLILGYAARRFQVHSDPVVDRIDAILPQTQCGQCGYPGCRPYAQAIAENRADINQCPPGGAETVRSLADLLGREPKALNPEYGKPGAALVALIDESRCIGCALCFQACPVDAIVGAQRQMHTVIADQCTGCELCLAPCPVDCIELVPVADELRARRPPAPPLRSVSMA